MRREIRWTQTLWNWLLSKGVALKISEKRLSLKEEEDMLCMELGGLSM